MCARGQVSPVVLGDLNTSSESTAFVSLRGHLVSSLLAAWKLGNVRDDVSFSGLLMM